MPRFFAPDSAVTETAVSVTGADARHIARSLRMAVGDPITVCTPSGREYECRLTYIRDELCEAEILSSHAAAGEPPIGISLYVAYPKGDKLETVVQKATELGAISVTPFSSAFVVRKPRPEKIQAETERLNRIAAEAAKQCRRGAIPTVTPPLTFSEMLSAARGAELPLFCYEGEGTRPLPAVLPTALPKTVSVVVGSEGGFSEVEADRAKEAGFFLVGLGKRILRCETAPLFALSCLAFRYEL
ncbi:MAG: 16S rRNA (uracil(1498)-N(3))-methyltransferase [Clostridia bacterium]|nr:16S rRNA (uracil(1498)-N(3))-methyltransferase [Clostridia bacterium]